MTYCLAMKVEEGLVLASDSRTNAGVDYVRASSKLHQFIWPGDRVFVLLTSGNLATTQAVVNDIERDLEDASTNRNLLSMTRLFDAACYVGELSRKQQEVHADVVEKTGGSTAASFILGGQIGDRAPDIFLIYPEGNCISASFDNPFLQIGETKYGKPILDRILAPDTSLNDAARLALVSLDSTVRSNISVGPPFEISLYQANSLTEPRRVRYTLDSPIYRALHKSWNDGLRRVFQRLPRFDWETDPEP